MSKPELAYWTIRIDDTQTREAFTLQRAGEIFEQLCTNLPTATITLCEVWIMPVKTREGANHDSKDQ
jgi:hypothetical protein